MDGYSSSDYDSDDPMGAIARAGNRVRVDTVVSATSHCCRFLPGLCRFQARVCRDCCCECDCRSGMLILLPLGGALTGIATGAGVSAGLVFPAGWYNGYGWHNPQTTALPLALACTVLGLVLGYMHPRPVYCVRVQRNPPLRCGYVLRGSKGCGIHRRQRRRLQGRLLCGNMCHFECLPAVTFLLAAAYGAWTVVLFSVRPALGLVPTCVLFFLLGTSSKFNRSRLRRLTRICCGRTTYEIVTDFNPLAGYIESEPDEDWLETSGSDDDSGGDGDDHARGSAKSGADSMSSDSDSDLVSDKHRSDEDEGDDYDSSGDDAATVTVRAEDGGRVVRDKSNRGMRKRAFDV